MENKNWVQILGSSSAPYINNTLLPMASHAELYFNPPLVHPSLPNYLWLEAGVNFGVFNDDPPSANHQSTTEHLVTLLQKSGISWKTYQEDISGADCPLVSNGLYAVKHNPFVYFDDVTNDQDPNSANCIGHVPPSSERATDLANNTVAQYNFITPNECNDMHDGCAPLNDPMRQGDTWLSQNLPAILNSAAYRSGGAVFVTWDEGEFSDGPIGMIVVSPFAKGNGYQNFIRYTHGSTLRTFQEIFGVGPFLRDLRCHRLGGGAHRRLADGLRLEEGPEVRSLDVARERARLRPLAEGLGESENERENRDEKGNLLVGGIDVYVGFGHFRFSLFRDGLEPVGQPEEKDTDIAPADGLGVADAEGFLVFHSHSELT